MTATAQQLRDALAGPELTLITLPSATECPAELARVAARFEAGGAAAAAASAEWLREDALREHGSARTWAWVGSNQLHGFFAISFGIAKLQDADLEQLQAGSRPLPAVLLAQAARNPAGSLAPGAILVGALGVAGRIAQLGGAAALILDPYDEPTGEMWQRRGFQPTSDKPRRGRQRLWRAL